MLYLYDRNTIVLEFEIVVRNTVSVKLCLISPSCRHIVLNKESHWGKHSFIFCKFQQHYKYNANFLVLQGIKLVLDKLDVVSKNHMVLLVNALCRRGQCMICRANDGLLCSVTRGI